MYDVVQSVYVVRFICLLPGFMCVMASALASTSPPYAKQLIDAVAASMVSYTKCSCVIGHLKTYANLIANIAELYSFRV